MTAPARVRAVLAVLTNDPLFVVGDKVRVLRNLKEGELGCSSFPSHNSYIGGVFPVTEIQPREDGYLYALDLGDRYTYWWPQACLEFAEET